MYITIVIHNLNAAPMQLGIWKRGIKIFEKKH